MDADHNFFTQLAGTKRFILHDPADTGFMRPFPRLHPLWHKAQCHPTAPAAAAGAAGRCPPADRLAAAPMVANVEPGDVLYIPPYTWHTVESVSASVSISSWSDYANVRTLMRHLYRGQP